MRTLVVPGAVFAAVLAGILLPLETVGAESQGQNPAVVYRRAGLQAAAAVTGSFVKTVDFANQSPISLDQLVDTSDAIVIATTSASRSFLSADKQMIYTSFDFRTAETMKGRAPAQFGLILPGGRVGFPGGSWAQINVRQYRRPEPQRSYLLFLRSARADLAAALRDSSLPAFEPAFDALGLYDVTNRGSIVRPMGADGSAFATELRRLRTGVAEFLELLARTR